MWKTAQAINFEKCEAVDHGRTVGFVNNFLVETTEFLNRFSVACDKRLREVSASLQKLEITMAILEAKLASIPGLENVDASSIVSAAPSAVQASEPAGGPPPPPPPPPPSGAGGMPPPPPGVPDAVQEEPNPSGGLTNKEDPRYQAYFRMQRMGVALGQIQQKMSSDGVDPSILSYVNSKHLSVLSHNPIGDQMTPLEHPQNRLRKSLTSQSGRNEQVLKEVLFRWFQG